MDDVAVDFAVAAWRENNLWQVVALPPRTGETLDGLVDALRVQPGETGVLGLVSPTLATLASFPVPLILIPVLFASFFANARDVFGLPEGNAARVLTPPDNDATPD